MLALAARDDGTAWRLRGELALDALDLERWSSLSPGERRRWQIAGALAREPRVLLLDEPTNHLDAEGRMLVLRALERWRGAGILVSHHSGVARGTDDPDGSAPPRSADGDHGRLRGGEGDLGGRQGARPGPAAGGAVRERRARQALAEARVARAAAERSLSGKTRDPKARDARGIGAQTRRAWAEARLGGDVRRLRTAADRAAAAVPEASVEAELGRSVFLGYTPSPKPIILTLDEAELRAGVRVLAWDVHVLLRREDRVRLAGANGAGKTTLLHRLLDANPGRAEEIFFLGQEVNPREEARSSTGCGPSRPTRAGGRCRWSPGWDGSRPTSPPRARRPPASSERCCSPRGWPGGPGRWCWMSPPTTWTFRPSSGWRRRSAPIPAHCSW